MTDDKTKQVIASMLKERVPTSFLDSGGTPQYDEDGNYVGSKHGYGRNFERNQTRDFDNEPRAAVEFVVENRSKYERDDNVPEYHVSTYYVKNIYHFLIETLKYDEDLDEMYYGPFLQWADEVDPDKKWTHLTLAKEFPGWVYDLAPEYVDEDDLDWRYVSPPQGLYGGRDGPMTVNTYSGGDALSQVMQYVYWEWDGEAFVALSIHGGTDVRGGYTDPHIFRVTEESGIFLNADGELYCPECHARWYTDDGGYHWYGSSGESRLKHYPAMTKEEWLEHVTDLPESIDTELNPPFPAYNDMVRDVNKMREQRRTPQGVIVVDEENHTATCPECGRGQLEAW